ncbi:transglycosylase SLT domain-containing protein [Planobispora siamensis]|nr:lytic transglycosylase domain-containing protein [Planobispora siamensis]
MEDQHARAARPKHDHRQGRPGPAPAPGDDPAAGPPGARAGRLRGRPLAASFLGLAMLLSGCAGTEGSASTAASDRTPMRSAAEQPASGRAAAGPSATPTADPAGRTTPAPPDPDVAIPRDPARLARALAGTTTRLRGAIDEWRRTGDPATGQAPEPVVLLALHQQRIYRFMARNREIASRTYAALPKALAGPAKENVTAIRELLSLAHPVSKPAKFRVTQPKPADVLIGHFRRAERRFGVDWEVLASVMFVETKFGRVRSPSHTGAKGPMQFMPGTWKAYGMGGDVHDTGDAILAAANYLHASGAPRNYRRALYAYNHSWAYVNAVQRHARQIKRDIRNYYAYYNWQVFVLTTRGERRLSGPS